MFEYFYHNYGWTHLLLLFCSTFAADTSHKQTAEDYDEWAIEIKWKENRNGFAKEVAKKHGLEFVRTLGEDHMAEFFHLRAEKNSRDLCQVTMALNKDDDIQWTEYQLPHETDTKYDLGDMFNMYYKDSYYESERCRCHVVTSTGDSDIPSFVFDAMNTKRVNESLRTLFNDYRWPCQWQLYNCGQTGGPIDYDLDVVAVWQKGITGKGMVMGVIDDGAQFHHPEIAPNYDPKASFDFVEFPDKDGPLPYPKKTHGTICTGIIGMKANNGYCGVGVVYEAKIGVLRMIGHKSTDIREAASLIYKANYIDVYSNSWGPSDTGKLFRKPAKLTAMSIERGAHHGRKGKGNLYVFASGNGGMVNDHCGADGFSCSIYTVAVGASTRNGLSADFSEECSCIMLTVPSTDPHKASGVVETMIAPDMHEGCINSFRGTSSVTPLASSILLMALQTNPSLTWRDAQYLIADTALVVDPTNKNWQINGAGYHVHHYYGFGAINALHMVNAAEKWQNVDQQQKCELEYPIKYRPIPSNGKLTLRSRTTGCQDKKNQVLKLEHVQVIISYLVKCRGDISVTLKSPCGTTSKLMNTRRLDDRTLLVDWPFMSVFLWGEDPRGEWTLEIKDNKGTALCTRDEKETSAGHMWKFKMVLWGVKEQSRRNLTAPVCDRLGRISRYYENAKSGLHAYTALLKSIKDDKPLDVKSEILHEFVEDFSEAVQESNTKEVKFVHSVPKKVRPYTIEFDRIVMEVWRNTFIGAEMKSQVLADYIVNSYEPNELSSRNFAIIRNEIARRLRAEVGALNDDGETITRYDLEALANALTSEQHCQREIQMTSTKLSDDTAAVLYGIRHIWH